MKTHEKSGKNSKQYFSRAIHKHGWENFTKEILIDDVPEEDLDNLEINYIAFYDSFNIKKGYNRTKGGVGASGYRHTEEQRMANSKRNTKNHNVEGGGSVYKHLPSDMWIVVVSQYNGNRKRIGQYLLKKRADTALKLYNETGECMASDLKTRKRGTGAISKKKNGRFEAKYKRKYVGMFASEEEAEQALKKRKKDISEGGVFVSTRRKKGTGYIRKKKNGRFTAIYQQKNLGTFDTNDEADQALKIHIVNL
jgi:hypothetical protein